MSDKRRKNEIENLSSTGIVSIEGAISSLITFQDIAGELSADINIGGEIRLVDRNDPFEAKPKYIKWSSISSLAYPASGVPDSEVKNFIIAINASGTPEILFANNKGKLPAVDSASGVDMNNFAQIGRASILNGVYEETEILIQSSDNLGIRTMAIMDALGVINNVLVPVTLETVTDTLNLNISEGKVISRSAGFNILGGSEKSDTIEVSDVTTALIFHVDRNDIVFDISFDLDTLNYEPVNGTIVALGNNKYANRFCVIVPFETDSVYIVQLGKFETNNLTVLATLEEQAKFSKTAKTGSIPANILTIQQNDVNLNNTVQSDLPRLF